MRWLYTRFAVLAPVIYGFLWIIGHQQGYSTILETEDAASLCLK